MVGTEDGALAERRTNNNELLEVPPLHENHGAASCAQMFFSQEVVGVRREV